MKLSERHLDLESRLYACYVCDNNLMNKSIVQSYTLPDGNELTIETGKLARLAHGSALVTVGNTMLLATVVAKEEPDEAPSFLPLSVDYQEQFAGSGKIPGGFFRREGKLTDHEVLISRLVDRSMRPLFPNDYFISTQISLSLISVDPNYPPDSLAPLAASTALALSHIPFQGPISAVRVAKINGEYQINPTYAALKTATLELIVSASKENILMVEGEAAEAQESELIEAMQVAHEQIRKQCLLQEELVQQVAAAQNPIEKRYVPIPQDEDLRTRMREALYQRIYDIASQNIVSKSERNNAFDAVKAEFLNAPENQELNSFYVNNYYKEIQKEALRNYVLDTGNRLDGRQSQDIRPISIEVDYLPSAHGSALFTRGETQALATATLGTKMDEQIIDGAVISGYKKFILHYNFPGFSTGEVKPNRGPGRREVGHGNLAARALKFSLPNEEENPYTIRVVSNVLESNGSSSMATVCASSLALMDAGVPMQNPVSGIAMGLVSRGEKYIVLSDILGDEDQLGDMDFKITGTQNGITACQMDIKLDGLSYEVLQNALEQAKQGRLSILEKMNALRDSSRTTPKTHAPRFERIAIPTDMIGAVIGPGGKVVQEIQRSSGATVTIEETDREGLVHIFAVSEEALLKAKEQVERIITVPTVGEIYEGVVKTIMPYGAFVEFLPGKSGLLHISEIQHDRLEDVNEVLSENDVVEIKLLNIDKKTGKYRLSRKELLEKESNRN